MKLTKENILKVSPLAILFGFLPFCPNSLTPIAWKSFLLFSASIIALILRSSSMGAIGIISLTIGSTIGVFSIEYALGNFGKPIVWQIAAVFFIARGFVKTGLSKRISYHIIKFLGKNVLGLSYGFTFANFTLGPLIPSSAARIGGIIFPIIKSVSQALGSDPENGTEGKIGSFFTLLCLYSNAIVSGTFLTAMAGNLIIKTLAANAGIYLTWIGWFAASCVPSMLCMILMPIILYKIYPPTIKDITKTREYITKELSQLGKFSKQEKQMTVVLVSLLAAWIFGDAFNINAILASFIGLTTLLVLKIIDFEKDMLAEKEAWHTIIWLSSLLLLGQAVESSGFLNVAITQLNQTISSISWPMAITILGLIYGYTHYIFASSVSHISAMYAVFIGVAIQCGAPSMFTALLFAFLSALFAGLTYYSSTEAVVLYNSKYVSIPDFFKYGFIMTTTLLAIWMGSGIFWWKLIGLY